MLARDEKTGWGDPMPGRSSKTASLDLNQGTPLPWLSPERTTPDVLRGRYDGRRPQFRDQPQDVGEQASRDGDFGHLEGDITAVADDFRADLDEFFLQARQRPVLIGSGAAYVRSNAEIVGQRMKVKTNRVGGERAA